MASDDTDRKGLPSLRELLGQSHACGVFDSALTSGDRVAGAYLLYGPEGVGRCTGALGFASALLCADPRGIEACGACRPCHLNDAGTHPDLLIVSAESGPFFRDDGAAARAPASSFTSAAANAGDATTRRGIPVRTLRRLLDLLALAPAAGGRKVAVIDSLDEIEEESVATLLKSLEEPPPATTFVVLARGLESVPDTILSRCQRARFQPLEPDVVRSLLRRHSAEASALTPDDEDLLVRLGQGSVGRAVRAAAHGLHREGRACVAGLLADGGAEHADRAVKWVDAAGNDLASRRERARLLVTLAFQQVRDRAAERGRCDEIDALLPALTGALESLRSNVSPELALRGLWARARRSRPVA